MPAQTRLSQVSINVFTRAPEPGRVKTRLIPAIGAQLAADLVRRMTRVTLSRVRDADIGPITLWCTPAPDEFLLALANEFCAVVRVQRGADLGERMHYALQSSFDEYTAGMVLGTDCPFISGRDLERARTLLFEHGNDAVLGPAYDGGYYLFAARALDESLFAGIPWGTGEVLDRTRFRLDAIGWRWAELEVKHDIDRPGDLALVRDLLEPGELDADLATDASDAR